MKQEKKLKDLATKQRREVVKGMQTCNNIIIGSVVTFLIIAGITAVFLTIKEMPEMTTLAPLYEMGYPKRPF